MQFMRALTQIKTRQKVLVAAIIPLIMMLVVGGVGILNIRSTMESNHKVTEAEDVLASANDMVAHATDLATSVRGYLLSGQESFLGPYESGRTATIEEIRVLEKRVRKNPEQVALLEQAEKILVDWQVNVVEPSIALRREIGDAETMNDLAAQVRKAEGKVFFDRFRAEMKNFVEAETAMLKERRINFAAISEGLKDNVADQQDAFHALDKAHRMLEKLELLQAAAYSMESGMRGYLLSGENADLKPFQDGRKEFFIHATTLESAFAGHQDDLKQVKALVRVVERWDNNIVKTMFGLRKQVSAGTMTHEQLQNIYRQRFEQKYFEKFRSGIIALRHKEEKLIAELTMATQQAEARVQNAIMAMDREERQVSISNEVVLGAETALEAALNMETGVRGFLLAGDMDFLAPYEEGGKSFFERIEKLKAMVSSNPAQLALLGRAEATIREWDDSVVKGMISLRAQIGSSATMDDMADLVAGGKGREYMDAFRHVMGEFKKSEKAVIAELKAGNEATETRTYMWVIGCIVVALVLGLALAVTLGNGISAPLVRMTNEMRQLASGNTQIKIRGSGRQDEIGDMASALTVFRDNAVEKERLSKEQERLEVEKAQRDMKDAERVAKEEADRLKMEAAAELDKRRAMTALANKFETTIGSVVNAVAQSADELQVAAATMSASAEQTNSEAEQASDRTKGTLDNVRSVSEAASELKGSILEISRQVTLSTDTASRAVDEASNTGEVVEGLSEMVGKIGQVLEIISDIAAQTNLLALNATIEAARAGDAGKGFAVVASEVKNLAGQTAKATEEIASHISAVQNATGDTVNAMSVIGSTITEVSSGISAIAAAIEEQGIATATISDNVVSAAEGSEEVATSIGTVREAATGSGAAAQQVLSAAEIMDEQSGRLHEEVNQFLSEVRAG